MDEGMARWVLGLASSWLVACGGPDPATPAASTSAAAPAPEPSPVASGPLDRVAAGKAMAAVDASSCYEKPPFQEASLHVTLTVLPNGTVTDVTADRPYGGTEAGDCAVALFKAVRVAPYIGPPAQLGRTVPHAPVRGTEGSARFDSTLVVKAVQAEDFSECLESPGAGVEKGAAMVAVNPSGDVRTVTIEGTLGGTPRGECIVRVLKTIQLAPYVGDPAPATRVEIDLKRRPPKK